MTTTDKLNLVRQIVNEARSVHNAGDLEACEELLSTIPDVLEGRIPPPAESAGSTPEPAPEPEPKPETETPATPETIGDRIKPPEGSGPNDTEG